MKKTILLLTLVISVTLIGQMPVAITIEPPDATAYDEMTLIFDPDEACFMSGSLDGLDSIAIHSGVTFLTGEAWQHVVEFNATGANGKSTTLYPTGDGRFSITYTPADFYGLNGEIVTQICAVFNNGTDWDQDGRDFEPNGSECMDFFIPIEYETGQFRIVPNDYPTIQEGINAALFGDTVLVDIGTYIENINFNGKNIAVVSLFHYIQDTSYISQTVIDGNYNGTVVTFENEEESSAFLCGFTITKGSSDTDGGGIYCEGSSPTIKDCYITWNSAVDGGGISCQYGADPSITNCDIKWNTASLDGGGLYHEGSCSTIATNCVFDNNSAGDEGGGIYYEINCLSTITDCEIINNEATNHGGGICCYDSFITVEGNTIASNTSGRGGGINADNAALVINNSVFESNEGTVHGGAFYYYNTSVSPDYLVIQFSDCTFNNNTTYGTTGGVRIGKSESDSSVIDVVLDNCSFTGNIADRRSAMWISGEDVSFSITNCLFENNTATTYVAGINMSAFCKGDLINCLFKSNHAATGGEYWNTGGANVWGEAEADIVNCTFVENTAEYGTGLTIGGGGIANVINCIFWDDSDNQITLETYNELGGILDIGYCDLQFGMDSVSISELSTLNWGAGNINTDPLFIGNGDFPYSLHDNSPCVNSGCPDVSGLNLPDVDLAGNPRLYGDRIEMGAYENQNIFVGIEDYPIKPEIVNANSYPNPFSTSTTIEYELLQPANIQITIYNYLGKQVEAIEQHQSQGKQQFVWNADVLTAGVYFCVFKTNQGTITTKLIKL